MGANTRHLLRGLSSLRSLLLPLLGESSHGGGSRTVPLHGATSGSSVRHVVCKAEIIPECFWDKNSMEIRKITIIHT